MNIPAMAHPDWRTKQVGRPGKFLAPPLKTAPLYIAKGIFVRLYDKQPNTQKLTYSPTVHGEAAITSVDLFPKFLNYGTERLGLITLGGNMQHVTVTTLPHQEVEVINTGYSPLTCTDFFTVEMPCSKSQEAQLQCASKPRTLACSGNLTTQSSMSAMYGGFMATNRLERHFVNELSHRLTRDIQYLNDSTATTLNYPEPILQMASHICYLANKIHNVMQAPAVRAAVLDYTSYIDKRSTIQPSYDCLKIITTNPALQPLLVDGLTAFQQYYNVVASSTIGYVINSTSAAPTPIRNEVTTDSYCGQIVTGTSFHGIITRFNGV